MYLGLFGSYRKDEKSTFNSAATARCIWCPTCRSSPIPTPTAANEQRRARMNIGFLMLTDYSEAVNGKLYLTGAAGTSCACPSCRHEWSFHNRASASTSPWHETNNPHELVVTIQDRTASSSARADRQLRDRPPARHAPGPGAAPGDVDSPPPPPSPPPVPTPPSSRSTARKLGRARFYLMEGVPEGGEIA